MNPVVLFDGTCNLCNGAVQFMLDRERNHDLRFAALQSDAGRALLERCVGEESAEKLVRGAAGNGDPDTIVFVEDGKVYTHSTAALRMARHLRAPWRWGIIFVVVPGFVRDAAYRFIARRRYRWFGKTQSCRVPTPELRARFLS